MVFWAGFGGGDVDIYLPCLGTLCYENYPWTYIIFLRAKYIKIKKLVKSRALGVYNLKWFQSWESKLSNYIHFVRRQKGLNGLDSLKLLFLELYIPLAHYKMLFSFHQICLWSPSDDVVHTTPTEPFRQHNLDGCSTWFPNLTCLS